MEFATQTSTPPMATGPSKPKLLSCLAMKGSAPTIHGLRGTGILARSEEGYEVDQIANDIGMSRQNVEHYMRFRDQMKVGADGQKRLRLVNKED